MNEKEETFLQINNFGEYKIDYTNSLTDDLNGHLAAFFSAEVL